MNQKVKILVVDAGAIIKHGLTYNQADSFITIPEVMKEIKDLQSKDKIGALGVDIKMQSPSSECLGKVTEFAKKTGDFSSLSLTDMKVVALTLMLEIEENGKDHIRTEPLKITNNIMDKANEVSPKPEQPKENVSNEDDDEGWITPSNIKKVKEKAEAKEAKDIIQEDVKVACITADYSIQNVLLQMNLKLISIDGFLIKRIKNWMLRCHACFEKTFNMEKKFCPKCGNPTLLKTSYSIDENGCLKYYLKSNFQYKIRGTRYSIPKPQTGQKASNLIFAEDQKEFTKAMKYQKKNIQKEQVFDPDYLPSMYRSQSARTRENYLAQNADIQIGYGRRNINQVRRK